MGWTGPNPQIPPTLRTSPQSPDHASHSPLASVDVTSETTEETVLFYLHMTVSCCTSWTIQDSSQGKFIVPEGQGGPQRPYSPQSANCFSVAPSQHLCKGL